MIIEKNILLGTALTKKHLILLVSVICMFCLDSFAQSSNRNTVDYRFSHFKLDLNNNRVETILRDSYGYLWIGTLGGLHKYDGANLVVYPSKGNSLNSQWHIVFNLFEDSKKRLWVSTNNGIYRYERSLDKFIHYPTGEAIEEVYVERNIAYTILEDDNHLLWIANGRSGLHYLDEQENKFRAYFTEERKQHYLADAELISIAKDESNNLWILTVDQGLVNLDLRTGQTVSYFSDVSDSTSISPISGGTLTIDYKNRLWITSSKYGVDRLDINNPDLGFSHYRHDSNNPNSLYNDFVVKVYSAPSGQVWLCNSNGGLHFYNESTDDFYRFVPNESDPFALSNLAIQTVFEDFDGRLWVGSHISGVEIHDKFQHKFDSYSHAKTSNSINNDVIRCFYEDKNDNIWIGTDGGGLNFFDREKNKFEAFINDENDRSTISANVVLSITEDSQGMLWLGTWGGNINLFDPVSRTFTQPYKDLEYVKNVYFIFHDSKDRMWVGTWHDGITLFDEKGDEMFHLTNDPNDPFSYGDIDAVTILEDHNGSIWVGTESNGVNLVSEITDDGIKFKRYFHNPDNPRSIVSNRITHLSEDSSGNLWIASEEGLSKYCPESDDFVNYGIGNGIVNRNVRSIAEDNSGNIWLGTSKGLTRFDPVQEKFRRFRPDSDGGSSHFSRYAVLKSSRGELLFGGEYGFVIFQPDHFSDNTTPTKTYLTGIKVMNQKQEINGENSVLKKHISAVEHLEFTHVQSVISFEYIGINFTEPDKIKYAHRMVGFDENWKYVEDQREATYMNLRPGNYTFEVKSCNNDEMWGDEYASLDITILPPWWLTWWAKTLFAVVFIGSLLSIYYARVFALNRQKEHLKEEVSKRTKKLLIINEELKAYDKMVSHDLKGPIGHIYSLAQLLKQDGASVISDESKMFLDQIIKSSNASRELIDGILTFASADQPGILQEEIDLEKHVREAADGHSLTVKMKQADINIASLPNLEKAISVKVYQLFYNLIGNALKFQKKDIKPVINIYRDGESRVVVEDNGIGFDQKYAEEIFKPLRRIRTGEADYEGYGIGLGICKRIVDFHGWDIKAYGEQGKGSKFVITF